MSDSRQRAPGRITESQSSRRRPNRRARIREQTLELVRSGRLPAFLLSVGLGVILVAFAVSDDYRVDTVVIRGNSLAYADSVVEQSNALGQPVFQINSNDVAESVAGHPVVDSARVQVQLPDSVIVEVVEREPTIVWQNGDRAVLVDEHGWVVAEGASDDLPGVVELDGTLPVPGSQIDPGKVAAVQYLNDQLEANGGLEYDERDGFQVFLESGRVVTFGDPEELPVKLEVVAALSDRGDEWTRLDVRDPERPVYQ